MLCWEVLGRRLRRWAPQPARQQEPKPAHPSSLRSWPPEPSHRPALLRIPESEAGALLLAA